MVTTVDRTKNINTQNKQTTKNQHPEYQTTKQHQTEINSKSRYKTRLITTQVIENILC